jgi:hypothetical protein
MACRGHRCGDGAYVCDDFAVVELPRHAVLEPPILLWPEVVCRVPVPKDLQQVLLAPLPESPHQA